MRFLLILLGCWFSSGNANQDASPLGEQKLNLSLYSSALLCIILAVYIVMVCTVRHVGTRRAGNASNAQWARATRSGARAEETR